MFYLVYKSFNISSLAFESELNPSGDGVHAAGSAEKLQPASAGRVPLNKQQCSILTHTG